MRLIQDLVAAMSDVTKARKNALQARDELTKAKDGATAETRFFERPTDSVARNAKKSILYFPVVTSESLSAETTATIAKAVQVRSAEYVRLWVSNMDPVTLSTHGKMAVVASLRGATLNGSLANEAAVDKLVRTRLSSLVEHIFMEDGLRDSLHRDVQVLEESKRDRQNAIIKLGKEIRYAERMAEEAEARNSRNAAELRRQAEELRDQSSEQAQAWADADRAAKQSKSANSATSEPPELDDSVVYNAAGIPHPSDVKATAERKKHQDENRDPNAGKPAHEVDPMVSLATIQAMLNGSGPSRNAAKQQLRTLLTQINAAQYDAALKNPVLGPLIDEINGERPGKKGQASISPEVEERERIAKLVKDTIEMANRTVPGDKVSFSRTGRAAAMRNIQELMASNNTDAIAKLRANAETAKIVNMMERIPGEVRADGTYDLTNTGNKAAVGNNISFDKLNAFQPVLLDLQIRFKLEDGSLDDGLNAIAVGVKGVAHPVPSMDLVTGLGTALQRDSLVLQYFRMTSGETSFVKDFVLNLNTAKMRASGRTTSGAKVLETLRRQSEWNMRRSNYFFKSVAKRGFVPPTTTMVVTADEVDQIKSMYGIDFSKPSVVRELLKSHNLMGFMIVDEPIGLVRVFEDGDDDFDRVPMATLKSQGKETSVKDIMTILARS
jgi:hypothetical protein